MGQNKIKLKKNGNILNLIITESSKCNIQGLSYIFQSKQTIFGKVFWTLVVSSMLLLSTFWSYSMYVEWQLSPVLTTVTSTAFPVEGIEFPAVTICGSGMNEEAFNAGILKQFLDYLTEMNETHGITPFVAQKLMYVKVKRTNDVNLFATAYVHQKNILYLHHILIFIKTFTVYFT